MNTPKLHVVIKTPTKLLFEGEALSITSENAVGTFDVLPSHSNFITLISKGISVMNLHNKIQNFPCNTGVIKCKDNAVSAYIEAWGNSA
jgi:F-type H+-transporting ATPase subunit epsilon